MRSYGASATAGGGRPGGSGEGGGGDDGGGDGDGDGGGEAGGGDEGGGDEGDGGEKGGGDDGGPTSTQWRKPSRGLSEKEHSWVAMIVSCARRARFAGQRRLRDAENF